MIGYILDGFRDTTETSYFSIKKYIHKYVFKADI